MSNHEPRNVLSYERFLHGVLEQIQHGCNFFNLHKSKMNSGRYLDNFTFEPLYKVRIIHL